MAKPFSKTVIHNTDAKLSKQVKQPLKTTQGTRKALTWRVVDIAVGAAVGVMSGVMFWVFDGFSYGLFPLMTLILPGSAALLHALFYFPATLGSLIVRKPGASAYVLLVASFVEVVLGTKYSVSLVVIALLQAAAVFALFRYRRWTLGVTILSALAIGIVYNFYLLFFYYQAFTFFSPRGIIGTICELLSAVAFAGFGSWGMYCALRKSGVLSRFASSHKEHNEENA
jgi:energy-coupling factor transport system substrate-specific component